MHSWSELISVPFGMADKDLTDCTCNDGEARSHEENLRPRPSVTAGTPHGLKQYTTCPPGRPSVHTRTITSGEEHTLTLTAKNKRTDGKKKTHNEYQRSGGKENLSSPSCSTMSMCWISLWK